MGPRNRSIRILIYAVLLFLGHAAQGQEVIRGIVVDSASLAGLPLVNIQVKHTSRGTITDDKGNFSITAGRQDTLVFSCVGYETLELPLATYEPGMIRLSEKYTLLKAVTIDEYRRGENPYAGMFDEQDARLEKSIPFYFSKARKEKIRLDVLKEKNLQAQTYLNVVVHNPTLKAGMMKKYALSEQQYYDVLASFNETYYRVMYHLTEPELVSLLNRFFETHAPRR